MGGRLGLKGTDGVANEAHAAGAEPVAGPRAHLFARTFLDLSKRDENLRVRWLTCGRAMGADPLRAAGVPGDSLEVIHSPEGERTTAADTRSGVVACVDRGSELLLFCGGDGTARDVAEATSDRIPILGIPAGVKMHSGLFAVSPPAAAHLLVGYLRGQLRIGTAEILDLDEEAYRKGEWRVQLFATAKTLVEPNLVAGGKVMIDEVSEEAFRGELAVHFSELFETEPDTLFLLGPGSTVHSIATAIGIDKTLLGVDAVIGGKTIAKDLNEKGILGRGNLQVSPAVLRRIGTKNVIVVATPAKLVMTPVLRVDTGDPTLDEEFHKREYLFVLMGYRTSKLHPIQG